MATETTPRKEKFGDRLSRWFSQDRFNTVSAAIIAFVSILALFYGYLDSRNGNEADLRLGEDQGDQVVTRQRV